MSIDSLMASKAYANAKDVVGQVEKGASAKGEPGAANFGEMLETLVQDAVQTGKASEMQAMAAVSGETEMIDVVTAITAAEMTLETVVAVRDKVIEAYDKIMRMPI